MYPQDKDILAIINYAETNYNTCQRCSLMKILKDFFDAAVDMGFVLHQEDADRYGIDYNPNDLYQEIESAAINYRT